MKKHGKQTIKNLAMKALRLSKLNSLLFLHTFLILIFYSCMTLKSNKIDNFYLEGKEYCSDCLTHYNGEDSTYLENEILCLFKNGQLNSVGKIHQNKKEGDWYYYKKYSDSLECHQVVRYNKNDSTVIWNRGLINESW